MQYFKEDSLNLNKYRFSNEKNRSNRPGDPKQRKKSLVKHRRAILSALLPCRFYLNTEQAFLVSFLFALTHLERSLKTSKNNNPNRITNVTTTYLSLNCNILLFVQY